MFDPEDTYIYNPNRLYHFTSADSIISILETMQLRPGVFQKSNDLFEEHPNVNMGNNVVQQKELESYINEHVTYLSFAKDSEDAKKCWMTYQRSPMWGLYAKSNSGACLVLDEERFIQENQLSFTNVWYNADYLSYKEVITQSIENGIIPSIEEYVKEKYRFLFYQKQLCWDFENEYRFVFIDAPSVLSIKNSIVGVILGHRFCETKK